MSSLAQVAAALESTLAAGLAGVTCYDVWTLNPTAPFAMLRFLGDTLDTFDGRLTYHFQVVFGVAAANIPGAQRTLYALASRSGSGSVAGVLEGSPTLGGVAETLMVLDMTDALAGAEIGNTEYLVGIRPVDVLCQP